MNIDDRGHDDSLMPDLTRMEGELGRLRPVEPSPELLGRWESLLTSSRLIHRTRSRWRMAVPLGVAAIAAAILLVWIWDPGDSRTPTRLTDRPLVADRHADSELIVESAAPRYSLRSYRLALAQSPADLDLLLARDSAVSEPPHRIFAFGRAGNESVTSQGDN